MSRHDPIALAKENRQALSAEYQGVCSILKAEGHGSKLADFRNLVEDWTISMNMREGDLLWFLTAGSHRNVLQKTEELLESAGLLGLGEAKILKLEEAMNLGDPNWYRKRRAYREQIAGEENFKYGAFFAGGAGLVKYGPFTVLLHPEVVNTYKRMFFVRQDSLDFIDNDLKFTLETFKTSLACSDNVRELVTVKHKADIADGAQNAFARLCYANSDEDRSYVEVQVEDNVERGHILKVLIESSYSKNLKALAKSALYGKFDYSVPEDQLGANRIRDFGIIRRNLSTLGINLEPASV